MPLGGRSLFLDEARNGEGESLSDDRSGTSKTAGDDVLGNVLSLTKGERKAQKEAEKKAAKAAELAAKEAKRLAKMDPAKRALAEAKEARKMAAKAAEAEWKAAARQAKLMQEQAKIDAKAAKKQAKLDKLLAKHEDRLGMPSSPPATSSPGSHIATFKRVTVTVGKEKGKTGLILERNSSKSRGGIVDQIRSGSPADAEFPNLGRIRPGMRIVSIAGVHVGPEMPGPDVVGMLAKAGNAVEIEIEYVVTEPSSGGEYERHGSFTFSEPMEDEIDPVAAAMAAGASMTSAETYGDGMTSAERYDYGDDANEKRPNVNATLARAKKAGAIGTFLNVEGISPGSAECDGVSAMDGGESEDRAQTTSAVSAEYDDVPDGVGNISITVAAAAKPDYAAFDVALRSASTSTSSSAGYVSAAPAAGRAVSMYAQQSDTEAGAAVIPEPTFKATQWRKPASHTAGFPPISDGVCDPVDFKDAFNADPVRGLQHALLSRGMEWLSACGEIDEGGRGYITAAEIKEAIRQSFPEGWGIKLPIGGIKKLLIILEDETGRIAYREHVRSSMPVFSSGGINNTSNTDDGGDGNVSPSYSNDSNRGTFYSLAREKPTSDGEKNLVAVSTDSAPAEAMTSAQRKMEKRRTKEAENAARETEKEAKKLSKATQKASGSVPGSVVGASMGVSHGEIKQGKGIGGFTKTVLAIDKSLAKSLTSAWKSKSKPSCVAIMLSDSGEALVLDGHPHQCPSKVLTAATVVPFICQTEPRYYFFATSPPVFLYSCPADSPRAQRMIYATGKSHLVDHIESVCKSKRLIRIELTDVCDLTDEELQGLPPKALPTRDQAPKSYGTMKPEKFDPKSEKNSLSAFMAGQLGASNATKGMTVKVTKAPVGAW